MKRRVSPQSPEVSGWEQTSDRDGTFMVVVSARKETWGRNEALRDEPEDRGLRNGSQNPQVQPADLGAAAEPGGAGLAQRQGREKGAGLSHGSRSGLGRNVSNRSSQSSLLEGAQGETVGCGLTVEQDRDPTDKRKSRRKWARGPEPGRPRQHAARGLNVTRTEEGSLVSRRSCPKARHLPGVQENSFHMKRSGRHISRSKSMQVYWRRRMRSRRTLCNKSTSERCAPNPERSTP